MYRKRKNLSPIQVRPRNIERQRGGRVIRSMMVSMLNRNVKKFSEAINLRRKYIRKIMPRPKSICIRDILN